MIVNANVLDWAESYQGEPFMAVLCDPPYGLNEAEIDIQAVLADWMAGREHQPKGTGFMGREWDAFVPGPRIWRALRHVCHPGAYLFAFGGTRTADLLGLALRLAGWERRDEIRVPLWGYSSGMFKGLDLSQAMDAAAGAERPVIGVRRHAPKFDAKGLGYREKDNGFNSRERKTFNVTAPATDLARIWDGYGTSLKPSWEPIVVFRNPLMGTYAENCAATGAGALNIDGARIGGGDGRVPKNLLLCHHPECEMVGDRRVKNTGGSIQQGLPRRSNRVYGPEKGARRAFQAYGDAEGYEVVEEWECHPECPVLRLGKRSGKSKSSRSQRGQINSGQMAGRPPGATATRSGHSTERGHNDEGTAERFFAQAHYLFERMEASDLLLYHAKASASEREAGLDALQLALLGLPLIGETGEDESTRRNIHPTIKPLALTRELATMLLPPPEYDPRILIPFCGSGSEYIGAMLAGWKNIVGVELMEQYCRIAEARVAYWRQVRVGPERPSVAAATAKKTPEGQLSLFD